MFIVLTLRRSLNAVTGQPYDRPQVIAKGANSDKAYENLYDATQTDSGNVPCGHFDRARDSFLNCCEIAAAEATAVKWYASQRAGFARDIFVQWVGE